MDKATHVRRRHKNNLEAVIAVISRMRRFLPSVVVVIRAIRYDFQMPTLSLSEVKILIGNDSVVDAKYGLLEIEWRFLMLTWDMRKNTGSDLYKVH